MDGSNEPLGTAPATWLLLTKQSPSYGGNTGYADDPSTTYAWDSTVAHGTSVNVGDFVLVWDEHGLVGASVIEDIDTVHGGKVRLTCPRCTSAKISARKHQLPRYRCTIAACHFEFDEPVAVGLSVTHSVADYGPAWIDLRDTLTADGVRDLARKRKSIQSIRPAQPDLVDAALPGVRDRLRPLAPRWVASEARVGHRVVVTRTRVGQGDFRRRLLHEHGEVCAMTGPNPAASLDAAHLYSYSTVGAHHDHGGLLLRRDMHALFDRHLLAVNPHSELIVVDASVRHFPHLNSIHDQPLQVTLSQGRRSFLAERWQVAAPLLNGAY